MSPRGLPITNIRERLFRAAERLLMEGGPGALSARSVAREADVAAGALYNHFDDFDDFLAELVIERFRVQAERARELPERAGSGTVQDNLTIAALALLESPTLAVADLVRARVGLSARVMASLDAGAPGMADVQAAIVSYLERERSLGRVARGADTEAAALMLTGAMHHLLLLHATAFPEPEGSARRVAQTIFRGIGGSGQ
jgi:AcrR family transcriptional regulator